MALTPFFGNVFPFERDPFFNQALSAPFPRLSDEFSTLFDAPLSSFVKDTQAVARTAVDVKETPTALEFVADLPGLKREEVKVQIEEGNVLCISGERTREERKDTDTFHRVERSSGKFLRKFRLPPNADTDHVSAMCQDGVLQVTVPKRAPPEPEKPKTVDVQVA